MHRSNLEYEFIVRRLIKILVLLIIVAGVLALGASAFVAKSTSGDIVATDGPGGISEAEAEACKAIDPQCILVLGCAVWEGGEPSPMLQDRLDTAIELYKMGVAPKLLLSGDNSLKEYSEPGCMFKYAIEQGVPAEDIFLDYAGFSTYESVYRSHAIFNVNSMIVVTQRYHMFRALHISRALGIESRGAAADQRKYAGCYVREAREVLARTKDLVKGFIKPKPTFLGDEIPIGGDGTVTQAF